MYRLFSILYIFLSLTMASCSSAGGAEEEGVTRQVIKYDNGNLYKVSRTKGNKLYGVQEEYKENGVLLNTITYLNGLRDGEAIMYYESGRAYRVTNYVRNNICGFRKKFYKDGSLWSKQYYHEGLPSTDLKEYDKKGKLLETIKFVIVTKKIGKNSTGVSLSTKGRYLKVEYFKGSLVEGKYFDKNLVEKIPSSKDEVYLKMNTANKPYSFIAKITTYAKNNMYVYKQVE